MNFINKRVRDLSVRAERIEITTVTLALLLVCLALPLLLKAVPNNIISRNDQWLMGPIVNCALVIVGVNFRGLSKINSVVILPSIVHIMNFYLFAIGTVYSLYLLPAIWLGNLAIVFAVKYLYVHKKQNFAISTAIAIAIKVGLVFGIYNLLCAVNLIPQGPADALWTRMGINQLYVAVIGCVLAFAIIKMFYSNRKQKTFQTL